MQRRMGFIASHSTPSSRTVTSRQSWPLGMEGVAPHSSILPAYQAGAGGNCARMAAAAQGAGSLARPAKITCAPLSKASMKGSGPIMATIRLARPKVSLVSAGRLLSGWIRPAASRRCNSARGGSARIRAMRKCSPSSAVMSRTNCAVRSRCGSPPAPPEVPIISGMPAPIAARSIRRKSRLIAMVEQNGTPAPR